MSKLPSSVHENWEPIFDEKILLDIKQKLGQEDLNQLCPRDVRNIFRMFKMPPEDIKVVIVGQDPYPDQKNANGIAFSVAENLPIPLSLRILAQDIHANYAHPDIQDIDIWFDKTLVSWLRQGVFMLNAALTCTVGNPKSHEEMWMPFMTHLFSSYFSQREDIVFYFLGNHAAQFSKYVKHWYKSIHPAATRYGNKFEGKWLEINTKLEELGHEPIVWTIPF